VLREHGADAVLWGEVPKQKTPSVLEELEEMEAKLADAIHAWRHVGGRASAYV
jgi:hypothetical protein